MLGHPQIPGRLHADGVASFRHAGIKFGLTSDYSSTFAKVIQSTLQGSLNELFIKTGAVSGEPDQETWSQHGIHLSKKSHLTSCLKQRCDPSLVSIYQITQSI